jgi:hypothetical protein
MVTHDDVRMEQPAALRSGLKKRLFEEPGAAVVKKFFAIVASAEHMVDRSRKLQPRFPCHLLPITCRSSNVKMYILGLTPFMAVALA